MTSLSSLADYKAYHILSYGTFLGTTFFHSFVGGVVAYRELPRPMFARLMEGTFPFYFGIQTVLPLAMMLTFPGQTVLQLGEERVGSDSGITGLFKAENRWTAMVPLMTMLISGAINTVVLGPATTKTMKQRHHQETRDGKKSYDAGPHSPEMQSLNRSFATLHGVSSLLNVMGFASAVYYGFVLAEKL